MNVSTPIASLVGDARGRLLEEVVRVGLPRSIREWASHAGVDHTHAASLLKEFEQMGLVRSARVGRSIVVEPVPDSVLRQKLQTLLHMADDIIHVAREAASVLPDGTRVFVFGSTIRDTLSEGSDIDICVIGPATRSTDDAVESVVARLSAAFPMPVHVLRFTPEEWDAAANANERIVEEVLAGVEATRGN